MLNIRKYLLIIIGLMLIFLQGCSTLADSRKAEGEGNKKTYQAGFDQTWDAALKSVSTVKLELVSDNKVTGTILAQRGMGFFQLSYGENVAVFIKPKSPTETTAEVVSKRVMQTNIFAPDWSEDIHKQMAAILIR